MPIDTSAFILCVGGPFMIGFAVVVVVIIDYWWRKWP